MPDELKKNPIALREEEILKFWRDNKIFEKSLQKPSPKGEFIFYDGPPFATGLPHYGHILAGTIKDAIPRFKTMRGFNVPRRFGWDCHGLPVENLVEKELDLKSKKDIVGYGVEKFNNVAAKSVMRFADDWRRIIPRLGRWVDMDNDYRTMDSTYTESVWSIFKTLYDKGLIYEGFKSMHLCPRCETTLSNFEVNQGYKDITDISVYVKFRSLESPSDYNLYFLAWTTTPWTLPGNVALAVGADIDYAVVAFEGASYVLAHERVADVFAGKDHSIRRIEKGITMVGSAYEPVFPYYNDDSLKNSENGFKVYAADFVTTVDGTGIVHIAPAFGEDDMKLGQANKLPFIQHIGMNGKFKPEVADFAGQDVKPKDDHQHADVEIIKYLAKNGTLFDKKKIIHSYPHCWRCDTPLLNYAASSWFVKVTAFRDKLVAANKKVNWIPEDIKEGRFGKWLEGARDWAISRSRFWGAPLPVWRCENCGKIETVGSIVDLKKHLKPRNTYYVIRHGEADNNVQDIISSEPANPHHLTDRGRGQVEAEAERLKKKNIDLIFASPFVRAAETAKIIKKKLGLPDGALFFDERIRELKAGVFNNKPSSDYHGFFSSGGSKFTNAPSGGETHTDLKNRVTDFLYDIDGKYKGKKILIVTHDSPAWLIFSGARGLDGKEALKFRGADEFFIQNAEVKTLEFAPLPHNENFELNLHRPFIDSVVFSCACGGKMKRAPEVFDCWFESGSMPYGQAHYIGSALPNFDPKGGLFKKPVGFPADFIAEGLDQTRGWFYSMIALGVGLFGRSPYKTVVVNGTVLAEDGQKMAKRLNNYPDPLEVVNRYGADALRFYLLSSPATRGQDLCFSEQAVDEVMKKNITRLLHVISFYFLYAENSEAKIRQTAVSPNVLDAWILARLNELIEKVTVSLEKYELDRASRPIADFVEDLSTWYLRRSRERFKGDDETDKNFALATTRQALIGLAKIMAPFTPFVSEDIYQKLKGANDQQSVHLCEWPEGNVKIKNQNEKLLREMKEARKLVSLGLEARAKQNIKVRQPLSALRSKSCGLGIKDDKELLSLVKDEVNVKEVSFDEKIRAEVELDTDITPELKEEGQLRELIRAIQDLRKRDGLTINDAVNLLVDTGDEGRKLFEKYRAQICKAAVLKNILVGEISAEPVTVGELSFKIKIER